jgi:intracellular multiplication protein IcmC
MKMKPTLHALATALILGLVSLPVWADNGGSVNDLPGILMDNLGVISVIMQTLAILIGLSLFVAGMFQLKRYGEMRTMMSSQMSISGPVMTLLAGVAMLCTPLFMGTLLVSFWGPAGISDLPYSGDVNTGWGPYIAPVLMFVRLIGVYAFMRGFVMAAKTGSGHAQPGTTGKVLVHIFAGILCVHIMGTVQLIESVFGLDFSL